MKVYLSHWSNIYLIITCVDSVTTIGDVRREVEGLLKDGNKKLVFQRFSNYQDVKFDGQYYSDSEIIPHEFLIYGHI